MHFDYGYIEKFTDALQWNSRATDRLMVVTVLCNNIRNRFSEELLAHQNKAQFVTCLQLLSVLIAAAPNQIVWTLIWTQPSRLFRRIENGTPFVGIGPELRISHDTELGIKLGWPRTSSRRRRKILKIKPTHFPPSKSTAAVKLNYEHSLKNNQFFTNRALGWNIPSSAHSASTTLPTVQSRSPKEEALE